MDIGVTQMASVAVSLDDRQRAWLMLQLARSFDESGKPLSLAVPAIDEEKYLALLKEVSERLPAHTPEWTDQQEERDTDAILKEAGRIISSVNQRNKVSHKHRGWLTYLRKWIFGNS